MLDEKAQEMFNDQVLTVGRSELWLADTCAAFVRFACEHPRVFRHLFGSLCADSSRLDAFKSVYGEHTAHIAQQEGVSEEKAAVICRELVTYAAGLSAAAMVSAAFADDVRAKLEKAYRSILAAQA